MFVSTNIKRGFSIIEVLVAVAVLSIGLITIIGLFPFSIQANKGAERQSLASSYARAKLEQMLITAYDEINTGTVEVKAALSNDPNNSAYGMQRQTVVTLVDGNLANSGTDVGLKKIVATVYWSNKGVEQSLTLSSILAQK